MAHIHEPSGSVLLVAGQCGAGSPARRRGNFLLRGQKKVTKEKALNRTPAPQATNSARKQTPRDATTRPASLSLLSLSPAPSIAPPVRLTRGCTPCSRGIPKTASLGRRDGSLPFVGWGEQREPQHRANPPLRRPSDAAFASPGKPGVQPALTGVKKRCVALITGTAARAQRFASARNDRESFRAPPFAAARSCAVQGLFFGDFLLAPQKKVTPPPGGTPGTTLATNLKYRAS
jgi:hypothetical protein